MVSIGMQQLMTVKYYIETGNLFSDHSNYSYIRNMHHIDN